jgi:hypothetical protein
MSVTDGEILRVVAQMIWGDGNINQNVFNAVATGGGAPFDDEDVIDDMVDWLDAMYLNLVGQTSQNLDGNSCTVYKYDAIDDDWDEVGSDSWSWTPSGAGDELPRAVAPHVRIWTTDPDVQGGKYLPAPTEAILTNGLWTAGAITNLLGFAADWIAPFVGSASGATFTPGVWSVVGTVFKAALDHYATSTIPAYQRRRKRNVGI